MLTMYSESEGSERYHYQKKVRFQNNYFVSAQPLDQAWHIIKAYLEQFTGDIIIGTRTKKINQQEASWNTRGIP